MFPNIPSDLMWRTGLTAGLLDCGAATPGQPESSVEHDSQSSLGRP